MPRIDIPGDLEHPYLLSFLWLPISQSQDYSLSIPFLLTNFGKPVGPFFLFLSNFDFMGFLSKFTKLRKNKEFNYQPRYYDDKGEGSPYKFENRFDKYRITVNTPRGLKGKFTSVKEDMQRSGDRYMKLRMAIIIVVLVLIFLYIIDFDLSIFFGQ